MPRRFQFSLRALMAVMLVMAAAAVPIGYWVRQPVEPAAIPVQILGTVTLDGAPLSDASVSFSDSRGAGFACSTDAAGRFSISFPLFFSRSRFYSILPGSYHVLVRKGTPGVAVDALSGKPIDPNMDFHGAIKYIVEPRSLIPERYGDPKTSDLVAEVRADKPNNFVFDLVTP